MDRVDQVAREPGMRRVPTPRAASLLLMAGRFPEQSWPALHRLHDQLPHPRAALYCGPEPSPVAAAAEAGPGETLAGALHRVQQALAAGQLASYPDLLPDEPPTPWRDKGPHGQGGEGMMGGTPYGRPMTMRGDELRDGLRLDAHQVTLGPFAPMLPPGLQIQLRLQGDVIQGAELLSAPFGSASDAAPFEAAMHEPASPARLERLRAAHHLRCLGRFASLRGASALSASAFRAADAVLLDRQPGLGALKLLWRLSGLRLGIAPGLGVLAGDQSACLMGPARRAAGDASDARADVGLYRDHGFRPIRQHGGDVRARLAQWLAEAGQALSLAPRLKGAELQSFPATMEGPDWPLPSGSKDALPRLDLDRLLRGLEWTQAVSVLASFSPNGLRRMLGGCGV